MSRSSRANVSKGTRKTAWARRDPPLEDALGLRFVCSPAVRIFHKKQIPRHLPSCRHKGKLPRDDGELRESVLMTRLKPQPKASAECHLEAGSTKEAPRDPSLEESLGVAGDRQVFSAAGDL
jgi:hypothetical protein